jgi:hypothetical protein
MGLSDEKAQEAAERSSRNIDAIVQSSRAYADATVVQRRLGDSSFKHTELWQFR